MGKIVEFNLKDLEKFEISDGKLRVILTEEYVSEDKVLKNNFSDEMLVYIDFKNFIESDSGKKIMAYQPTSKRKKEIKALLKKAIRARFSNFYCTKIDPSFSEDGERIVFEAGKMPAVGKSYNWWEKAAKEFLPERNSRLGTKLQYVAFLGVLMQKLVEEKGMSVKDAWNAVCKDSKDLGHYYNSKDAKHNFEPTGSREICGFCDLANTFKILAWDDEDEGFWLAGSGYGDGGSFYPLASLGCYDSSYRYNGNFNNVGWLVLS